MKIGKNSYFIGALLLILGLFIIVGFNKLSLIKATEKEASYTLEAESTFIQGTNDIEIKINISNSANKSFFLSVDGIPAIQDENFIENMSEKLVSQVNVVQKEKGLLITPKNDRNLELSFLLTFESEDFGKEIVINLLGSDERTKIDSLKLKVPKQKSIKKQEDSHSAIVEKANLAVTPYSGEVYANVTDWGTFQSAISTPAVTHINVMKDISNPNPTANVAASAGTINRPLTIQGVEKVDNSNTPISFAKRKIDFGNSDTRTGIKGLILSNTTSPSTLSMNNIILSGHSSSRLAGYHGIETALIYSTGANSTNWTVKFTNVDTASDISKRVVYNLNGRVIFDGGDNTMSTSYGYETSYTGGATRIDPNWFSIIESKYLNFTNQTNVTAHGQNMFYRSSVQDSEMTANNQSKIDVSAQQTPYIGIDAANAKVEFSGQGTTGVFSSATRKTDSFGGAFSIDGVNALIKVDDQANLEMHATDRPAILMESNGGIFDIDNNSLLNIIQDNDTANDLGAAIRFRLTGNMTFNIKNGSKLIVNKKSGTSGSAGIRMRGANNKINVESGAEFEVINNGEGSAIEYEAGNGNEFNLHGKHSTVDIWTLPYDSSTSTTAGSAKGRAISATGQVAVTGGKDTIFKVQGNSRGPVFRTGPASSYKAVFEFENMLYYDFRNIGTGTLFYNSTNYGALKAINSDLSIWPKGDESSFNRNPLKTWTLVHLGLNAAGNSYDSNITGPFGMDKLGTVLPGPYTMDKSVASFMNATTTQRLSNMGRLNGNNATPIIDELRTPTNADKYIFGHVGIPEGLDGNRDAWTDEVTVEVKVTKKNKQTYTLTGKTYGADTANPNGISIYDEAPRVGMFKIPNTINGTMQFFEVGDEVEIIRAWRGDANPDSDKVHLGTPNDENASHWAQTPISTIDVTPPTQAVVSSELNNASKQLSGTSDENGAKVFVKVNNDWLKDAGGQAVSTTVNAGKWTLDLPRYLTKDDKVDVYLKDQSIINPLPSYALPKTYTQEPDGTFGNINVEVDGYDGAGGYPGYHDAINVGNKDNRFDSAKRLITKDILPDVPRMSKKVISSGGATTQVNDILTYTLTAENGKTISTPNAVWNDVVITDVIPTGLDFSLGTAEITLNGKPAGAAASYDEATRTLKVKVGNLAPQAKASVIFKAKVNKEAIGQKIYNTGIATGNSPQELNFVPGPVTPPYATYKAEAKVGSPGQVAGILDIISAPESLDFGTKNVGASKIRSEMPEFKAPLTVSDNRAVREGWTLTVKMTQPLTSKEDGDKKLSNALRYKKAGEPEFTLDSAAQEIYRNETGKAGDFVISDSWSAGGEGFKLEVPAANVRKLGEYQAFLLWQLSDTK